MSYSANIARTLLERAIASASKPSISASDVDVLMRTAESHDNDGQPIYTSTDLNKAAALGWSWKAGLTSDKYDLGGGSGKYLTQSQWYAHCRDMQRAFAEGEMSIDGAVSSLGRGRGIGVVGLISSRYGGDYE